MNHRNVQGVILIAVCLNIFGLPTASSCADPANAKSKYLRTIGGGFNYDFDTHRYKLFLLVEPRNAPVSPMPFYLLANFENPQSNAAPLLVKGTLEAGKKDVNLETGNVSGMRDRRKYLVTVQVYADKANTQLIDTHKQAIMFHYVPNIDSYDRRPMKPTHGQPALLSNRPSTF